MPVENPQKHSRFALPHSKQNFNEIKTAFRAAVPLPCWNPDLETLVETNASDFALGGIASQKLGGVWSRLAFYSRSSEAAELNYDVIDRELLAIV